MDERDKRLLNAMQAEIPLTPRPFEALGIPLNLSEGEVLARVEEQKRRGIVRQIGGIFDTRSLGYHSSLVAMRVPPERLESAAETVNGHPGVSHNYRRDHAFNLWFTIAAPPGGDLAWTVARLRELAGAESARLFPTLRLFKIGVRLDLEGGPGSARGEAGYSDANRPAAGRDGLRPMDIAVIRELQEDLSLVPLPFAPMARRIGISEAELLTTASRLRAEGYLRRMAAVLRHREAGFRANAMGVWAVPADRAEDVGTIMGSFAGVSHCYLRPTYPDWPYNVFTMVHGQDAPACQSVIDALARATGVTEYALLYSTKEYKKVRLRYFTPELDSWEVQARRAERCRSGAPGGRASPPVSPADTAGIAGDR
jgi:DNA-binding Lrp family transcriptional regulator